MKFGRKGEEAEGKGKEVEGKEKGSENWADDLQRTVIESKDSAMRSARSFRENSSTHLHSLQNRVPHVISFFKTLEDTFFKKVKDELLIAKEHPGATVGIAAASALLLMRGPRRFLVRQTLGRFQTEEGQFLKAEKNVKEFSLSVDMMKNESKKLLERTALAEKHMKHGLSDLLDAGRKIQHFSKSVYKVERQASDLMDGLRQIPGREAMQLRAEVASTISLLKKQRSALDKRIVKISDLGVPV